MATSSLLRAGLLCAFAVGLPALEAGAEAPAKARARAPVEARLDARPVNEARVERVLASMSLRQRVAQLLLAYPQIDKVGPVEVGGLLFVGRSLSDLVKAKAKIDSSVRRSRIPPFVAVDMEGGDFNRMKSHPAVKDLPSARAMASLSDEEVERWGQTVGASMREIGLNMNLAPVYDIATRGHMFDNGRAFSGDPAVAAAKANAFSRGLLRSGVVPIGKHYPGYGSLSGDSDHALVTADWTLEELGKQSNVFHAGDAWLGGVMMSNVAYTAYGPRPAILNPTLVGMAHARGWMTMTDDVSVKVLADAVGGTSEDVLREAFLAGNDLLLTTAPPDWAKGLDYVGILVGLVEAEPSRKAQLDESCRRVLKLKDRLGMLEGL